MGYTSKIHGLRFTHSWGVYHWNRARSMGSWC